MMPLLSAGDYNAIDFLCQQIFLSAKHKNKCLKNDGDISRKRFILWNTEGYSFADHFTFFL